MKKCCSNCMYWDEKQQWDEDFKHMKENRLCTGAIHISDVQKEEPVVVCDGSCYMGLLYTTPNHFCKLYIKDEKETGGK